MRCSACGGDNLDGAKFCGVCGQRVAGGPSTIPPATDGVARRPSVPPQVTGETRQMAPGSAPPRLSGLSLDESVRVPEAGGARAAKIGLVLALDAALAVAGVLLLTRGGGGGDAVADSGGGTTAGGAGGALTGTGDAGADPGLAPDPGTGGGGAIRGRGAGPGGGTSSGGASSGGGGGGASPGAGAGGAGGGAGGSGGASGSGAGSDDPIGAAAAAAAAAVAGPDAAVPVVALDARAATPAAIDAAPPAPAIDAATPATATPDAAADEPGPDAAEAASATQLAGHLARLVVQASGKMDRCYQNATKALPDDQPLVGEVDIGLAVMPTGAVQNVRVTRNTTGSNDLGACVQATAEGWTFPSHGEGEPIEFVHVFRFGPRP